MLHFCLVGLEIGWVTARGQNELKHSESAAVDFLICTDNSEKKCPIVGETVFGIYCSKSWKWKCRAFACCRAFLCGPNFASENPGPLPVAVLAVSHVACSLISRKQSCVMLASQLLVVWFRKNSYNPTLWKLVEPCLRYRSEPVACNLICENSLALNCERIACSLISRKQSCVIFASQLLAVWFCKNIYNPAQIQTSLRKS